MQSQLYSFAIFILNGILIGLLFDIFRILRKGIKTADIITAIQDITFWLLSGTLVLFSIFKFNNGELRFYIFIGLMIGILIYLLVFSNVFIETSMFFINIIKKIIWIIINPKKFKNNRINTKKKKDFI